MATWVCLLLLLQHTLAEVLPIIREVKSNSVTGPLMVDTLLGRPGVGSIARDKRSLFTVEYEQELIDQHNNLRRTVPSSDMEFMTRHRELTRMAEDWAKLCIWEHGQPDRDNPPFEHIGQNLYAYNGTFDAKRGIQLWFDEYEFYDYNTGDCSKPPCGHYTQMAWSTSRRIGCAFAYCPSMKRVDLINANYLVCNYGPAGNWVGQKPYKKGPMCTECENGKFWCSEGLCDRGCSRQSTSCDCKAMCNNCGTTLNSNCSCTCAVGWHGPTCTEECIDTHHYCGANPGWPKSYCDKESVRKSCPVLCETCQVQTGAPVTCRTTTPGPDIRMTVPTHPPDTGDTDMFEIIPDESGSSSRYDCHNVSVITWLAMALLCIAFR